MTAAETIKDMEPRHKIALGAYVALAGLVLTILGGVIHTAVASGSRGKTIDVLECTVNTDHEPRLRAVEASVIKQDTEHKEIMRRLDDIHTTLRER